ncbi:MULTISPECIES: hypothetical protein [unclassified Lysinibacillus]|uniref:hypothetical protein n=1 Tax=unclassified Lysinibacillus TaxID=2636778 RepID=UPI00380C6C38
MAKTIKFNLICDGKPVRTLDDLKNNFAIEDIITYFNNNLLQRWLNVRGYNEELEKVEKLQGLDTIDLVKELIAIFDIEADPVSIEENTYILQYKQEVEFLLGEYKKVNFKVSAILDDYHTGYRQLVETIIENKNNIANIKATIKEIDKNYFSLFEMDYRNLFYIFLEYAPMAVFVMLTNDNMRGRYLPTITNGEDGKVIIDTDQYSDTYDKDKKDMYSELCNLLSSKYKIKEILEGNLKIFSGETDGYWKDVEPKGKRYMILSMESGNYIRSTGVSDGVLDEYDINNEFVILDGIDYKSKYEEDELWYMEV